MSIDTGAPPELYLESLPESVVASIEVRDAWRRQAAASGGVEFVINDLARWVPGSRVRVAFLDGTDELHEKVAGATAQISESCNLELDFGRTAGGSYRRWTPSDATYAAEIRVSFDLGGYFSLIGTDSADRTVGGPGDTVGGRPGQRSLNLGGYATALPARWEGTVRHEFLHALGFSHGHQNLRGPCEQEFRWDDDAGYVPTQDARGMYVKDANGRRPGIYTYLAGFPNGWSRAKVDHNLRTVDDPAETVGAFDRKSIMLYSFADFFYQSSPSPCTPTGNGVDLSEGDKRGLRLLYPATAEAVNALADRADAALQQVGAGDEAGGPAASPYAERMLELLRAQSGARVGAGN
ncbi:MAG: hypothetical protein AB7V44_30475 [Pseudonocardia sp.]